MTHYINIGRIDRQCTIRAVIGKKVFVNFYKCSQWNNHGFNKDQVNIIISAENQRKISFNQ